MSFVSITYLTLPICPHRPNPTIALSASSLASAICPKLRQRLLLPLRDGWLCIRFCQTRFLLLNLLFSLPERHPIHSVNRL